MTGQGREDESSLEAFFFNRVRLVGGNTIKMIPYRAGIPDRCVIMPGNRIYFAELKADDGAVSRIQAHEHAKLKARYGVKVYVVRGRQGVLDFLREIVSDGDPTKKPTRPKITI